MQLEFSGCILSKFYIKPQRSGNNTQPTKRCILSKFYIKPQQKVRHTLGHSVVSYRNSTSNHNWKSFIVCNLVLYLIEILHQTTTSSGPIVCITSCILSKFYIKPQLDHPSVGYCFVVSYRNSTSNHNSCLILLILRMVVSYRNSTSNHNSAFVTRSDTLLYLIEILHQTTTFDFRPRFSPGCILSKFYIKPQRFSANV